MWAASDEKELDGEVIRGMARKFWRTKVKSILTFAVFLNWCMCDRILGRRAGFVDLEKWTVITASGRHDPRPVSGSCTT